MLGSDQSCHCSEVIAGPILAYTSPRCPQTAAAHSPQHPPPTPTFPSSTPKPCYALQNCCPALPCREVPVSLFPSCQVPLPEVERGGGQGKAREGVCRVSLPPGPRPRLSSSSTPPYPYPTTNPPGFGNASIPLFHEASISSSNNALEC